MSPEALEVEPYLAGVAYPANKDELIAAAVENEAPQEVVEALQALAAEQFGDASQVRAAFE